jgi:hypothetical protein
VIVTALLAGIASIGYIGVILLLFFYVYAVLGLLLFQRNDPWHFGQLHVAMLTLIRCVTLDDWTDVMYINMYGCDKYGYEPGGKVPAGYACAPHPLFWTAMAYFVVLCVIGTFVLLSLFVGVITTAMEQAAAVLAGEQEAEKASAAVAAAEGIGPAELEGYRQAYRVMDRDDSKTLEPDEIRLALQSVGYRVPDAEVELLFEAAAAAGGGGRRDGVGTGAGGEEGQGGEGGGNGGYSSSSSDDGLTLPQFVRMMHRLRQKREKEAAAGAGGGGSGNGNGNGESQRGDTGCGGDGGGAGGGGGGGGGSGSGNSTAVSNPPAAVAAAAATQGGEGEACAARAAAREALRRLQEASRRAAEAVAAHTAALTAAGGGPAGAGGGARGKVVRGSLAEAQPVMQALMDFLESKVTATTAAC